MTNVPARLAYQNNPVPDTPDSIPAYLKRELPRVVRSGPHISNQTQTVNYLISGADEIVLMDTTTGNLNATLPDVTNALNLLVTIVNIGANTLTVVGTVSGSVNPTLAQWKAMTVACNGSFYVKVGEVT